MQSPHEFIGWLYKEVVTAREKKIQIDLSKLENVLKEAAAGGDNISTEQPHIAVEKIRAQHASDIELMKGAFSFGAEALRAPILINGGAAVALLSFLGSQLKDRPLDSMLRLTGTAIVIYVVGVGLAGAATATSYLTQFHYAMNWEDRANSTITNETRAKFFHMVTGIFVVCSYVAFARATYLGLHAFGV